MPFDSSLCVLCQSDKKEPLICPANNLKSGGGSSYVTLAANLKRFQEIGTVPIAVSLDNLDDGRGKDSALLYSNVILYLLF